MRRLLPVLLAAVAVLATGCFKADVAIDVKEDGSGDIRAVEAFDVDALRRLSGASGDALDDLVPRDADLPPGITASPYSRGSYEGVELRARFDGIDELDDRLDDMAGALAGSLPVPPGVSGAALGAFHVQPTRGGGWAFTGIGLSANVAGLPPDVRELGDDIDVRLAVTLPGRPLDRGHNADEIDDGNTFVWHLSPGDVRRRLYAETVPGRPAGPGPAVLPWVLAGVLVAMGAGALALGLTQRHRPPGTRRHGPPPWSPSSPADPAPVGRPAAAPSPVGGSPSAPRPGARTPATTGPSGWPLRPPLAPPTEPRPAPPPAPPTGPPSGPPAAGSPSGWGAGLPPRRPDDLSGWRDGAPR